MDTNHNGEEKVGIPESIVLNGIEYSVKDTPELQKFIQAVSKVEKNKLYSQFENLKAQIANLGKVKITNESNSTLDADTLVEKLKGTFVTQEDLRKNLQEVVKEVVQPVLAATEQNRQNELAQYREKLIQDNIATCIPELVKGETKEELEASLKESIRLRSAYPTPSTQIPDALKPVKDPLIEKQLREAGAENPTPPAAATPQLPPTPPAAPHIPSPEVVQGPAVKQMSMSEFERNRESLMENLKAVYGGGSL